MSNELTFGDFYQQAFSEMWPVANETLPPPEPRPIVFPDASRRRHFAAFGGTGVGKSRFLEGLIMMDVARLVTGKGMRGVGLIDVHGDIYRNVRARLAILAQQFPEVNDRLVLIDPTIADWTVKFNPLELAPGEVQERKADMLANVITTLYHDDPTITVRLYRVVYYSFLALMLAELSVVELPEFLRNRQAREALISELDHPPLSSYWLREFPAYQKGERQAREMVESTLNRLDRFVADPHIAAMFANGPSTLNFRQMLDNGAIVLVNAPKGILGEGTSYLLCAFVLAAFQQAAMSRVELPEGLRRPFTLLCDEFANYTTDTIRQIIAESRKVGLELGLAAQEVRGQLKTAALQSAVINTVQNILSFRLGYEDADTLVRDIFTPDIDQVKAVRQRYQAGWWTEEEVYRPLEEIWEIERRKLTQLPDRMLYWKSRGHPGSHLIRTLDVADIEALPDARCLPEMLCQQEEAVCRAVGQPKNVTPWTKRSRRLVQVWEGKDTDIPAFEVVE